jgi:hypothetical protein
MKEAIKYLLEHLNHYKDAVEAIAVGIGGMWALFHFVINRERYPRAILTCRYERFPDVVGKQVIRTVLCMKNIGPTLIEVMQVDLRLYLVAPYENTEYEALIGKLSADSPELDLTLLARYLKNFSSDAKYEIEPGEDLELPFDFAVSKVSQTVVVYAYVKNATKRRASWPYKRYFGQLSWWWPMVRDEGEYVHWWPGLPIDGWRCWWQPLKGREIGWFLTETVDLDSLKSSKNECKTPPSVT